MKAALLLLALCSSAVSITEIYMRDIRSLKPPLVRINDPLARVILDRLSLPLAAGCRVSQQLCGPQSQCV